MPARTRFIAALAVIASAFLAFTIVVQFVQETRSPEAIASRKGKVSGLIPSTNVAPSQSAKVFPFVFVFIDDKTEAALGPFPYDRKILATAVDRAAEDGARAVVLKFFLDRPKSSEGDAALATAMLKIKVVLEAHLDETETNPNALPGRFFPNGSPTFPISPQGNHASIPLPMFSENASDVGFVDYPDTRAVPVFEQYQNKLVKSLAVCCIELACGVKATIGPQSSISFGGTTLPLDQNGQISLNLPAVDAVNAISFLDFYQGKISPELIKDRVVIVGYDSEKFERIQTPMGPMNPHRFFCNGLIALFNRLTN